MSSQNRNAAGAHPAVPGRRALASAGVRAGTRAAVMVGLLSVLAGCSVWQPPQPWEKGDLAKPVMRMDSDPLEARFSAHTYFSKEAASGGGGVGGGGCGCN